MIDHVLYIAILSVYSVILIILTLKAPSIISKIKIALKNRKKQKHKYIKKIVREYLDELRNGESGN